MAKKLKSFVKSVTFRSNIEVEKYRHVHVEAAADIAPGDNPEDVMDMLKVFVAQELRRAKDGKLPASMTPFLLKTIITELESADAGWNNITVESGGESLDLSEYINKLKTRLKEMAPKPASTFRRSR